MQSSNQNPNHNPNQNPNQNPTQIQIQNQIQRIKAFMSMENADPSLVLLGLIPQKQLIIQTLFGISMDGRSYGVRMHPLFPVRLLDMFDPSHIDAERGMVRPSSWPMVMDIFAQLCDESFTPESWFPCPAPLHVYGEDIRCFSIQACSKHAFNDSIPSLSMQLVKARKITMEQVLQNILHAKIGWQGHRATKLADALSAYLLRSGVDDITVYMRCVLRGRSIRLYTSLLMADHQCEDLRGGFRRWFWDVDQKETFSHDDNDSPEVAKEQAYVFDFKRYLKPRSDTGGSPEMEDVSSFSYEPEDLRDLDRLQKLPAKPSDLTRYLRFVKMSSVDPTPKRMKASDGTQTKCVKMPAGVSQDTEDKENTFINNTLLATPVSHAALKQ